jgi:hypothetical protein
VRYASSHSQFEREAGPRHDGLHSQSGNDGLRSERPLAGFGGDNQTKTILLN